MKGTPRRQRLDLLLVERGLAPSRQSAQALILAGRVQVRGAGRVTPGARVAQDAEVRLSEPPHRFVGRGGLKLAGALDTFGIVVTGVEALDIGSSTGGFTDCLLQRGAARVHAVDVGRGQLDWRLRNDARVVVLEGLNARHLEPAHLPGLPGGARLIVVDVSFISLRLILPRVAALLRDEDGAAILALVKPQFEVGRGKVGKGGIVRDAGARAGALRDVGGFASGLGLRVTGMIPSPIRGADGNVEFFLRMERRGEGWSLERIESEALRAAGLTEPSA